jgi:hypothetical protein
MTSHDGPSPSDLTSHRSSTVTLKRSSSRLGLRRTSWQLHLPQSVQRLFAAIAQVMDGPIVLSVIVLATLVSIFLEDIKGQQGVESFLEGG